MNATFCCSKFMQVKYRYGDVKASYMAGAAYDVSMILSPFLGRLIVSTVVTNR